MGVLPFLRREILRASMSTQRTSFPLTAKQVPVTMPTYPAPIMQIFIRAPPSHYDRYSVNASSQDRISLPVTSANFLVERTEKAGRAAGRLSWALLMGVTVLRLPVKRTIMQANWCQVHEPLLTTWKMPRAEALISVPIAPLRSTE